MSSYQLVPAFEDAVQGAQRTFRTVLKALSEPGVAHELNEVPALGALSQAGYALALCLLDSNTKVWLSPSFTQDLIQQNLAFHCACPFVTDPEEADFAFLTTADTGVIALLKTGTDRDPEYSCTAIVQIDSLEEGELLSCSGPGILDARAVNLTVDPELWRLRQQMNCFPRGIDMLFIAQNKVMGLARTTTVQPATKGNALCM